MTLSSVRMSHVALAVSDLQTSLRFYTEGLGFEVGLCLESGDEVAGVSEVAAPVRMVSQYRDQGRIPPRAHGLGSAGSTW